MNILYDISYNYRNGCMTVEESPPLTLSPVEGYERQTPSVIPAKAGIQNPERNQLR